MGRKPRYRHRDKHHGKTYAVKSTVGFRSELTSLADDLQATEMERNVLRAALEGERERTRVLSKQLARSRKTNTKLGASTFILGIAVVMQLVMSGLL